MKRLRSTRKYFLTDEQRLFLEQIKTEAFKLSEREGYVVNYVLQYGKYHDNYQYHLNNIGNRYKKFI